MVFVSKAERKGIIEDPDLIKGLPKSLFENVLGPFLINSGRRGMPLQVQEVRMES